MSTQENDGDSHEAIVLIRKISLSPSLSLSLLHAAGSGVMYERHVWEREVLNNLL